MSAERERVREEFARRDADAALARRYANDAPAVRLAQAELRARLRSRLAEAGLLPLGELAVLDVGCGSGGLLRMLDPFGGRLLGVDLSVERLGAARRSGLAVADAAALPFADGAFDLVCQSTVLSSVLDPSTRSQIAAEMARVLRPRGHVVWYDFIWNPLNSATRGLRRGEIGRLFPGFALELDRATLLPPLARVVAPRSLALARVLGKLTPLRTHYLGLLRREF